jgi:translocation and assembly module TamA
VIRQDLDTGGDPWKARFFVDPGPPLLLASVDVKVDGPGAQLPKFAEIVRAFPLRPGQRLEHAPYDALKAALARTASQNGYLDAKFVSSRISVDLDAYTSSIEVHLETGQRYFFGPVRFEQDVLDDDFVNSYVTFEPGDPYNVDSLIAMQSALGGSPYFARVEVEPRRDQMQGLQVPIDVRLDPARRLRYTLGAGYGAETGAQVEAALEFRRLNKRGHRGTVNVLVSQYRNSVGLQYQLPRAFGRDQLLTHSISLLDEETDAQHSRGGTVGSTLAFVRGRWQQSLGVFFQRQDFTVGADTGKPDLLFPELTWTRVRTADRIKAMSGDRIVLLVRGASDQVVSDVGFAQAQVSTKWIGRAGKRDRVIVRADAGGTRSNDFRKLPPNMRYFSGGAASVRAYGYQELGPQDANGEPLGGQRLLFSSAEYDHRVVGDWGVAAFFDIGNALEFFSDPLKQGAGTGLRWASPVGMVRFDIAWPINDRSHGSQLQFSIGPDL